MKLPAWLGPFLIALFAAWWMSMAWADLGFHSVIAWYASIEIFAIMYLILAEARRMETGEG